MASVQQLAAALADDDDYLLLIADSRNSDSHKSRIDLEKLSDNQFRQLFRFDRNDFQRLRTGLGIADTVVCRNRTALHGNEALCILLRRLAYPNRLEDLTHIFGRSKSELSYIINTVLDLLFDNHRHRLENVDQGWLHEQHLRRFAACISDKGAPLPNCWGFIDGTVRPICRPSQNQGVTYNGHKRIHGLKFQSISTPSGMVASLYGPVEGRRHDAGMLHMSGTLQQLQVKMTLADGTTFPVYGDPAYPLSVHIVPPFRGAALSPEEQLFNRRMATVRVTVEWVFGKIISLFAFLDYRKNLKLYLQPVGKYYLVAALLTNCHTCLYGSETGSFFGLEAPALEQYLS